MEIIKKGKIPPQSERETEECFYCETEFSYTEKDIKNCPDDQGYVVCPVCGKRTWVW